MIGFYSDLYTSKDGKPPKYKRYFSYGKYEGEENLVHHVEVLGKEGPVDMTQAEAITSIIEQQVGRDNYSVLLNINEYYIDCILAIEKYKECNELKTLINMQANEINELSKEVEHANIKDLDELDEKIKMLQETKTRLAVKTMYGKPLSKEQIEQRIMELKELCQSCDKQESLGHGLKKFSNPQFAKEVEQDYIDTMLLPLGSTPSRGEIAKSNKKEQKYRDGFKAQFKMFEMEMFGLKKSVEFCKEFIKDFEEEGLTDDVIKRSSTRAKYVNGIRNISTYSLDFLNSVTSSPKYTKAFLEHANRIIDSNYLEKPIPPDCLYLEVKNQYHKDIVDRGSVYLRDAQEELAKEASNTADQEL